MTQIRICEKKPDLDPTSVKKSGSDLPKKTDENLEPTVSDIKVNIIDILILYYDLGQ